MRDTAGCLARECPATFSIGHQEYFWSLVNKFNALFDTFDAFMHRSNVGWQVGSAGVGGVASLAPVGLLASVDVHMVVQGSLVVETPHRSADGADVWFLKIMQKDVLWETDIWSLPSFFIGDKRKTRSFQNFFMQDPLEKPFPFNAVM